MASPRNLRFEILAGEGRDMMFMMMMCCCEATGGAMKFGGSVCWQYLKCTCQNATFMKEDKHKRYRY